MSTAKEAIETTLAARELAEKLASAREEQREVDGLALIEFMHTKGLMREGWTDDELLDALHATPLTFEPLRIRIEEQKADLEQAGRVCGELALELESAKDDRQLLQKLLFELGKEVGKTGESEGAVDVVLRLIRERNEARAKLSTSRTTCAFCEAVHELPCTFEDIRAHIEVCPKHPLAAVRAELAAAKAAHLETQRELDWHRHGAKK